MKNKLIISLTIIVLILIAFLIVWFTPKAFGKGVSPEQVDHIIVFDGQTEQIAVDETDQDIAVSEESEEDYGV